MAANDDNGSATDAESVENEIEMLQHDVIKLETYRIKAEFEVVNLNASTSRSGNNTTTNNNDDVNNRDKSSKRPIMSDDSDYDDDDDDRRSFAPFVTCNGLGINDCGVGDVGFSDEAATQSQPNRQRTQLNLIDLPNEILDKILRYLSFETLAKRRTVCRRLNAISSNILNSEFHVLRNYTQQRFQAIKAQMPRRESLRRKHPLARESDIIETLHMRLTLLQMTFGKHIERKHCCFFAGEILDEVHRILKYIKTTSTLSRAYKVTDELFDLSTMAMEYFKEHIEPTLPEITYFGVVDYLLDYSSPHCASPKTQLSLMESTTNDMHPHQSSNKKTKRNGDYFGNGSDGSTPNSTSKMSSAAETIILKRKIRRINENFKRNNGQITVLKRSLRASKTKLSQQQRLINNLKSRFDSYDKKLETTNRKLSAVLHELSRCKTELQYWRSKSPSSATPVNGNCTPCDYDNLQLADVGNASVLQLSADIFQPITDTTDQLAASNLISLIDCSQRSQSDGTDDASTSLDHDINKKCKRKLAYKKPISNDVDDTDADNEALKLKKAKCSF